ncbi:hypothetical protein [Actinoplanes siamensis]|uniref:hypothetical protein n=1 Tax=Actinoplanes siamensis TaxID=1223317 RepID=UPI001940EF3C|nr:hypothetical protein [Actinoplanes siamensis]
MRWRHPVAAPALDVGLLRESYDLIVAGDGVNSTARGRYADAFGPTLETRQCR